LQLHEFGRHFFLLRFSFEAEPGEVDDEENLRKEHDEREADLFND